jgi:hypothetical protein
MFVLISAPLEMPMSRIISCSATGSEEKTTILFKVSRLVLATALCFVAALAFTLFFFAVPVWDDLIRATRPLEVGWWGYVIDFVYKHWQGRWASCGLECIVLPRVNISRYYGLLIGAVALINSTAVYLICRWLTPNASRKATAFMTAALLALLWTGMPSVGETVYWFTGAVENAMVYALAAFVVLALLQSSSPLKPVLRDPEEPDPGAKESRSSAYLRDRLVIRILVIALLALAAICISGFHELYGLMFCLTLALGTLAAFSDPKADRVAWITVTIAASAGLLVVILAPGNSARFETDGGPHARKFFYDLQVALAQVRHYVPRWIIDPKMLAVSVWVLVDPMVRMRDRRDHFPWRWMIPLAWLVMLAAGFFAPSWAFGNAMPPRTLSGVYILFVFGWLGSLYLWAPTILPRLTPSTQLVNAIAVLVLSVSLFLPGSAYASAHDLYHRIIPWHIATERRYALLRKAEGTDALVLPLPTRPWVLLDGEIENDPGDYRNWSTVSFFHLRSIRLIPAHGSPPPPPDRPTRPPAKGM